MSHLKNESVSKCFTLLRKYIDETSTDTKNNKKNTAILALNQLRKVTAGVMVQELSIDDVAAPDSSCSAKPRAQGSPHS